MHFPLDVYLHRIAKSDMDNCQECVKTQKIPTRETINHFIFICPAYNQAREELEVSIGENNFQLSRIMSNTDYMKALFINGTGKFQDQNQPQPNKEGPGC